MFIYNVTTKVNWNIHEAWLAWMKEEHMPAMIKTNCFVLYQLLKLHEHDEEEGPTYVAQFFAESKALYNRYMELHISKFNRESAAKWGDYVISFSTLLEVIE